MIFLRLLEAEMCRVRMINRGAPLKIIYLGYEEYFKLRSTAPRHEFSEENGVRKFRGVRFVIVDEDNYLEVY